jgi:uncharacterized membrane protein
LGIGKRFVAHYLRCWTYQKRQANKQESIMLTLLNQFPHLYAFNRRVFTLILLFIVALFVITLLLAPNIIVMAGPAGSGIDHCSC